jgi:hypothetical protein
LRWSVTVVSDGPAAGMHMAMAASKALPSGQAVDVWLSCAAAETDKLMKAVTASTRDQVMDGSFADFGDRVD